jgi:hypothetical protein
MTPASQTSLLVISCDRYVDVWPTFFTIFHKTWPDCPYPLFLGTNYKRCDDPRVTTIPIGDDVSWAHGARLMLNAIASDYVITFLEDFLIEKRVDTAAIERLVEIARAEKLGCLRLAAGQPLAYPPTRPVEGHAGLGVVEPGEPYRVSAQVAIWHRATLEKYLIPGASPWEFEVIGSALSNREPELFWAVYEPAIVYDQVIEKGKWKPEGLRLATEAGVKPDLNSRGVFSPEELAGHIVRATAGARPYQEKTSVIQEFRKGRRGAGVRMAMGALRRYPGYLTLWVVTFAGVVGPRFLSLVESVHARGRARAIGRRTAGRSGR